MFTRVRASPFSITTASSQVVHVQRSLPSSARSAVTISLSAFASVWRGLPVCDNSLVTFVDASLTMNSLDIVPDFRLGLPNTPIRRSSDEDSERTPARQRRRHPPDARGGAPRLCGDVDGLHGRSMERRKGAPDMGRPWATVNNTLEQQQRGSQSSSPSFFRSFPVSVVRNISCQTSFASDLEMTISLTLS
jgi:hypothetical protein